MKVQKLSFILVLITVVLLTGCKGKVRTLTKATGAPYEVLVVAENNILKSVVGSEIKEVFESSVPGLPQPESQFRVSEIPVSSFDNILKPVRNIFIVEIDDIYTQPKFSYARDVWSDGQMVLYLKSPDLKSLEAFIPENKDIILDFFINSEINRVVKVLNKTYNRQAEERLIELMGVTMNLPGEISYSNNAEDFFWMSNNSPRERMDVVVYSVPYNDINAFTAESIIARRDSIMKLKMPGEYPETYMTTAKIVKPEYRQLNVNGKFVAELRGLWEVKGDMMGGPFVSHTRLDEVNQRVITAEIFVFAPEKKKRNTLRRLESSLYTLRLPQENMLPEIPVTVTK